MASDAMATLQLWLVFGCFALVGGVALVLMGVSDGTDLDDSAGMLFGLALSAAGVFMVLIFVVGYGVRLGTEAFAEASRSPE